MLCLVLEESVNSQLFFFSPQSVAVNLAIKSGFQVSSLLFAHLGMTFFNSPIHTSVRIVDDLFMADRNLHSADR